MIPAFESKPDVVFLLSAMRGRIACEKASSLSVTTNLSGVNNVAQLCKLYSSKLIYVSTSEIYGPDCDPMHEDISNPNPNNRYGLTKLLGEKLIEYDCLHPFLIFETEVNDSSSTFDMILSLRSFANLLKLEEFLL